MRKLLKKLMRIKITKMKMKFKIDQARFKMIKNDLMFIFLAL